MKKLVFAACFKRYQNAAWYILILLQKCRHRARFSFQTNVGIFVVVFWWFHCARCSQSVMRICGKLLFVSRNFSSIFFFVSSFCSIWWWNFAHFFLLFFVNKLDNDVIYNFSLVFNQFERVNHRDIAMFAFTSFFVLSWFYVWNMDVSILLYRCCLLGCCRNVTKTHFYFLPFFFHLLFFCYWERCDHTFYSH